MEATRPLTRLLRPKGVAAIYDIPEGHQAKMRCNGTGPAFIRIGNKIYYEPDAIEEFIASCRRTSTSDPGPAQDGGDAR